VLTQLNASLRYHYKVEPTTLSVKEWCRLVAELEFVRADERAKSLDLKAFTLLK
jgi:hypothetical protein